MNYRAIFLAVFLFPSMAYALYDLADNPLPNRGDGGQAVMEEWRKRYEQASRERSERETAEREEKQRKYQEDERVRKEEQARKDEEWKNKKKARDEELARWESQEYRLKYIAKLEKTYGKRVHFESRKAERAVRNFNIDCRTSDKRFLPLIGILHARLATADREDMWIETTVQERAGEVRIIDSLHSPKAVVHTSVVFQINKWGELQGKGSIRAEAITNACFGSHGPIWLK